MLHIKSNPLHIVITASNFVIPLNKSVDAVRRVDFITVLTRLLLLLLGVLFSSLI